MVQGNNVVPLGAHPRAARVAADLTERDAKIGTPWRNDIGVLVASILKDDL